MELTSFIKQLRFIV